MKYNELVDTCLDYLRRPDLKKLVQERVLNAITAVHSVGIFAEDRTELIIPTVNLTAVNQVVRPADLRLVEQVFLLDDNGAIICNLARKTVTELVKLQRLGKDAGTYYETNGAISYKTAGQVGSQLLIVGTLKQIPPSEMLAVKQQLISLDNLGYESWLMAENSQAIIDYVVGHMEYVLGNTEQGSNFLRVFNTTHREWLENRAAGIVGL